MLSKKMKVLSMVMSVIVLIMSLPLAGYALAVNSVDLNAGNAIDRNDGFLLEEKDDTTILYEFIDKREPNVKHFRLSDGSNVAVSFSNRIHYKDGNDYEEIDNTLILDDNGYLSQNGEVQILFNDDMSSNDLVSFTYDKYNISLSIVNDNDIISAEQVDLIKNTESVTNKTYSSADSGIEIINPISVSNVSNTTEATLLKANAKTSNSLSSSFEGYKIDELYYKMKNESSIKYTNILPGVDIRYDLLGDTLKEYILLKEKGTKTQFSFEMDTTELVPNIQPDGSIKFINTNGDCVFTIPVPYMFDESGATSYDVEYQIETLDNNKYLITVIPDSSWINSPDREYPIAIDPAITLTKYGSSANNDIITRYYSQYNGEYPSGTGNMFMGYDSSSDGEYTAFMKINNLPTIPSNSILVKAHVYLGNTQYSSVRMNELTIGVHMVNGSSWYQNYDINAMDYSILSEENTVGQYVHWDVTPAAKDWYSDPSGNLGVVFKGTTSYSASNCAKATFRGYNNTTFAQNTQPKFVVYYRNTVGLEDYYTYHTQEVGRAGTGFVRDFDAKLTFLHDFSYNTSEIFPITIAGIYNLANKSSFFSSISSDRSQTNINTLDYSHMIVANGWKLNIQQTIIDYDFVDLSGEHIEYKLYTDSDGTEHYFYPSDTSDNTFLDEDGLSYTITEISSTTMELIDQNDNKKIFYNGYLYQIIDANGNTLTINYGNHEGGNNIVGDGKPSNNANRIINITQQTAGTNIQQVIFSFNYSTSNYLSSISDKYGNTTELYCNNEMGLSQIKHPDGVYVKFYYDTNNRLIRAYDSESEYGIDYTYDNSKDAVTQFEEFIRNREFINGGDVDTTGANYYVETTDLTKSYYIDTGSDRVKNTNASDVVNDDIVTTYLFDDYGRTVNCYSASKKINDQYPNDYTIYGTSASAYTQNTTAGTKTNNKITKETSTGGRAVNLILNSGAENGVDEWFFSDNATISNSTHRTGAKSFELTHPGDESSASYVAQIISADRTGDYTLSAYVNIADNSIGGGARLEVYDELTDSFIISTLCINDENTNPNAADGWQRLSVTFQAEASKAYVVWLKSNISGAAYFDDVQLEYGNAASSVNLVENGNFEGVSDGYIYGWSPETLVQSDEKSLAPGENSIKITSNSSVSEQAITTVPINGTSAAETFMLSGWGYAYSIPSKPENVLYKLESKFELQAKLLYTDNTTKTFVAEFSRDIRGEWQYTSVMIVPEKPVSQIEVRIIYDNNNGSAYFDNISLTRENVQSYKYNSDGQIVAVNSTTSEEGNVYSYSGANLIQSTCPGNGSYTYEYNNTSNQNDHLVTKVINDDVSMSLSYYVNGLLKDTELSAEGYSKTIKTSATYSNTGEYLLTETSSLGVTTQYAYSNGYLSSVTTPGSNTGVLGNVTTNYTYNDDNGKLISVYTTDMSVNYTYTNGYLTQINRTDNSNNIQSYYFTYDEWGNMTSVKAGNNTLVSYTYAAQNGNMLSMTYGGNSYTITYSYDKFDRIHKVWYNNELYYTYYYNSDGTLERVEDNNANTTTYYFYDNIGRLIRKTEYIDVANLLISDDVYNYDEYGRTSNIKLHSQGCGNELNYTYNDTDGTLSSLDIDQFNVIAEFGNFEIHNYSGQIEYTYDALKRLSAKELNDTYTYSYSYADNISDNTKTTSLISSMVLEDSYGDVAMEYHYEYDNIGNIKKEWIEDYYEVKEYTYDEYNQLIQVIDENNDTWVYEYDDFGNILSEKRYDNNILRETNTYTYGNSEWRDQLTAYNGVPITYNSIGNPLSYYNGRSYTFTWTEGKKLSSVLRGSKVVTYTYEDGLRTQKTVNGETHYYYYSNDKLIAEIWGGESTKQLYFVYDETDSPYAMIYSCGDTKEIYYYGKNAKGDITDIYDSDMNMVANYYYDAWGRVTNIFDPDAVVDESHPAKMNPFRYRGYYYDEETGLYYVSSRYYDPEIGRFINADDIDYLGADGSPLSYNLFAYCMNNPVNRFDVNGNCSMPNWLKVTVGAVAIAGLAVASVCTGGAAAVIFGAALSGAIAGGASGAVMGAIGGGISGGWQGALDGACSGFMSGTLIGGATGAASAGLNIATGATTVVGNAHGSTLHKLATNMEAGKMAASGQYSQIGINKSLGKMGLNGGLTRPDVIGIGKNGVNKLVEVVSPRQSTTYISTKMSNMLSNNPGTAGKIVNWVRRLFK